MATKNFDFNPEYYDLQVNWEKRMEKERDFFEDILNKGNIKRVLEIGCGTGHHAEMFAGYVPEVVAMDPDADMVAFAGKNVIRSKNVTLYQKGFEDMDSLPPGEFDLITSLGNTLPILGDKKKIKQALKKIKGRLAKDGTAVLQFLNFSSVIIDRNNYYPPKVFEKDGFTYVFIKHFQYGRQKTRVDFIITRLKGNTVDDFFVNSSYLATLKVNIFKSMAVNAGFKNIKLIGTGGKEEFDPRKHISLYAVLAEEKMMDELKRFGVSIEKNLLANFDKYIDEKEYQNRSEALRDLIRKELIETAWEDGNEEVAGAIIMVYDHHRKELVESLVGIQHDYHDIIISSQHVHLDHDNCLEIIAVKGKIKKVYDLEARLKVAKGVKHAAVARSTLAKQI